MIDDENFKDKPFEEKIRILNQMTEKQLSDSIEQLKYICKDYCGKCPTYQETGETELAFCTIGKSKKIKEKKMCLCKKCPVYKMMSFRWKYYCMEGSAIECSKRNK
ncbi:MAG: DUF2769 domain-containing protein [Asgard group archaeon]|nr:DUF2769 domain-containing protein [Asgard group archaeon]